MKNKKLFDWWSGGGIPPDPYTNQPGYVILRPLGTVTPDAAITWELLTDAQHAPEYFSGYSTVAGELRVTFPAVTKITSITSQNDEKLATFSFFIGTRLISTTTVGIVMYQRLGIGAAGYLVGNGAGFDLVGDLAGYTFHTNDANTIDFTPTSPFGVGTAAQNADYFDISHASYVGGNNRRLKKITPVSGYVSYQLLDSSGVAVVTNDAEDVIEIMLPHCPKPLQIDAGVNDSAGFPGAYPLLLNNLQNIWTLANFKLLP